MPGALQDSPLEDHPHGGGSWEESGEALAGQWGKDGFVGHGIQEKSGKQTRSYVKARCLEENNSTAETCERNRAVTWKLEYHLVFSFTG